MPDVVAGFELLRKRRDLLPLVKLAASASSWNEQPDEHGENETAANHGSACDDHRFLRGSVGMPTARAAAACHPTEGCVHFSARSVRSRRPGRRSQRVLIHGPRGRRPIGRRPRLRRHCAGGAAGAAGAAAGAGSPPPCFTSRFSWRHSARLFSSPALQCLLRVPPRVTVVAAIVAPVHALRVCVCGYDTGQCQRPRPCTHRSSKRHSSSHSRFSFWSGCSARQTMSSATFSRPWDAAGPSVDSPCFRDIRMSFLRPPAGSGPATRAAGRRAVHRR